MLYGNTVSMDATGWCEKTAPQIRTPTPTDGPGVWGLIEATASLDKNSLYCNLLQCSHFAGTCAIAEQDGVLVGWLSGYVPPDRGDTLFVWQICVDTRARGLGLAKKLIGDVLARPALREIKFLECTITEANTASWALFGSVARVLAAQMQQAEHFRQDAHFGGRHDSELAVSIGPFHPEKVPALQA